MNFKLRNILEALNFEVSLQLRKDITVLTHICSSLLLISLFCK